MTDLRRSFTSGLVVCVALILALGGVIRIANAGHHRPEGAAERWLAAVGDTTRNGVGDDAARRVADIGPLAVAAPILPTAEATDGKSAFPDLEVGRASVVGGRAFVPYRLHQRAARGENPELTGSVVLDKQGDDWRVAALAPRRAGARVPSEGGSPPSRAPLGLWVGALTVAGVVTVVASALIERAGKPAGAPA